VVGRRGTLSVRGEEGDGLFGADEVDAGDDAQATHLRQGRDDRKR
jgi:hypothetical protein